MFDLIIKILMNDELHGFLIKFFATRNMNYIFNTLKDKKTDLSLEEQLIYVYDKALISTCNYYDWCYDENVITMNLIKEFVHLKNLNNEQKNMKEFLELILDAKVDDSMVDIWMMNIFVALAEEKCKTLRNYINSRKIALVDLNLINIIPISKRLEEMLLYKKEFCDVNKKNFSNAHILLTLLEIPNSSIAKIFSKINVLKFNKIKESLQQFIYFDFPSEENYCEFDINSFPTIILAKKIAYFKEKNIVDEIILFSAFLNSQSNTLKSIRDYLSDSEFQNLVSMAENNFEFKPTPKFKIIDGE